MQIVNCTPILYDSSSDSKWHWIEYPLWEILLLHVNPMKFIYENWAKKIDLSSNLKRKCMASRIHRQKEETMCWRVEGLAILRNPKLCVLVKREKTLVADVSLRIPKEYLDNLVKVKPLKNLKHLSYEFFKCIWSTMFVNFGINAVLSFYAW